jgi:hypothetical protein
MTRLRGPIAATAATALFLLSACARPASEDAGAAPGPSAPTESAAGRPAGAGLAIRISQEGGFVPPERIVGRIPDVSVYADGRVVTQGPQIAIYPGPAMPNLQVRQLDAAATRTLLDDAVAAGVRGSADLGSPGVADAPTTRIDVVRDGVTHSVSAVALREAMPDDPRLTPEQQAARQKLAAFLTRLDEMAAAPGQQPYRAETLAALAQAYRAPEDGLPEQPGPIAWPGPALPGEYLSPTVKIGCVTVSGAGLDAVLAAAEKANQNTPWTSGGNRYQVTFRPLLPDEAGCADLKAAR